MLVKALRGVSPTNYVHGSRFIFQGYRTHFHSFSPILETDGWGVTCEIALRRISLDIADNK